MVSTTAAGATRRDFHDPRAAAAAGVGVAGAAWPFIEQTTPSATVPALPETEVDLAPAEAGRIRRDPAPEILPAPFPTFLNDTKFQIG